MGEGGHASTSRHRPSRRLSFVLNMCQLVQKIRSPTLPFFLPFRGMAVRKMYFLERTSPLADGIRILDEPPGTGRRLCGIAAEPARNNRYEYCTFYSKRRTSSSFSDWLRQLQIHAEIQGELFDFADGPLPRGFHGNVCEYSACVHYRIYSRELSQPYH